MKTVKDLIAKHPTILKMNIDGLDFVHTDSTEDDINDTIAFFTEISHVNFCGDISSLPSKGEYIYKPHFSKTEVVYFIIRNNVLYIDDRHNEYKVNYELISDNYLKIALEFMYYIGMYDYLNRINSFTPCLKDKIELRDFLKTVFNV